MEPTYRAGDGISDESTAMWASRGAESAVTSGTAAQTQTEAQSPLAAPGAGLSAAAGQVMSHWAEEKPASSQGTNGAGGGVRQQTLAEPFAVSLARPPLSGAGGSPSGQDSEVSAEKMLGSLQGEEVISNLDSITAHIPFKGTVARGGVTLGGGEFGLTSSSASLDGAKMTQAGGQIKLTGTYLMTTQWDTRKGTGPNGEKNVPNENAAVLTAGNYQQAVSDLTPEMSDLGGRPPRTQFWAQDLTERHELVHVRDHQQTGKQGLQQATAWLGKQTASGLSDVQTLVSDMLNRVSQHVATHGAGVTGELHAYGDGASAYKGRADAIKAKGDKQGYK